MHCTIDFYVQLTASVTMIPVCAVYYMYIQMVVCFDMTGVYIFCQGKPCNEMVNVALIHCGNNLWHGGSAFLT